MCSWWKSEVPRRGWAYYRSNMISVGLLRRPTTTTTVVATHLYNCWSHSARHVSIPAVIKQAALPSWGPSQDAASRTTRCLTTSSSSSAPSSGVPKDNKNHPSDPDNTNEVREYLVQHLSNVVSLPAEQQLAFHQRLLQTLEPVYGKHITVRHLQSFGTAGLQALAQSVQQELANANNANNNDYITVRFKAPHHHTEFDLPWSNYETDPLLSVAERTPQGAQLLSEYLERACSGNAMCSTCHVYIENNNNKNTTAAPDNAKPQQPDDDVIQLNKKSTAEKDMLDLAYQPDPHTSRLACQVRVLHVPERYRQKEHEPALTVILPAGVNNRY